jgi:hypothetical protein
MMRAAAARPALRLRGEPMKALRVLVIVLFVYVGIVSAFESLIGVIQPSGEGTLVITTTDASGGAHDRVVSKLDVDGKLYVAANHWPRSWYRSALAHPAVQATIDGKKGDYAAVPVEGAEYDAVEAAHPHGFAFKFLTGFPPRKFLRLDPR